ncbi:MAG: ribosome biogenesis/translation initiation ATPase RLI [Nanoarchaeota archaeon]|nr:ribosome biogenesis/translation initiation ATPase RLI [Nanoarchaeota archaeon]
MTRLAVIEKEKCNPNNCGNYLCIRFCPVNRTGKECIIEGEDFKARIQTELCTGCGICPKRCPYGAIHIINLPEELDTKIIHQYGDNGFHLYSLPTPMFGKVVGIVGKNGIGKSTAIKILAGVLKPNMGGEKEAEIDQIIEFFKGSEAQNYFEKLKAGDIKVSYKPQAIDQLPKLYKGTVKELLQKVDETGQLNEVAERLDLNPVMDNDISKISGGELQRLAIAGTVLKKANLYLFDEPTSYLDIKQRIRLSKFLRELASKDTAVLVIEHDLIVLDYMADLAHIMYGKEAAYGIVSHPKPTRTGLNIYLQGFLKEENIRFRDHVIAFPDKPPIKDKARPILAEWPVLKKQLGSFSLEAEQGSIEQHRVIGILGANGIGKTSFVRILAGELQPDEGEMKQLKVSYKPQYLTSDNSLVAAKLKDAARHEVQLMRPLDLKGLMTKRLNELSGGELQRVTVAECLAREADLYLLDEPSAYLDVEQRLELAKIINDRLQDSGASALIVDHDLLFAEAVAERLIVFDGQPAVHGILKGPYSMEDGMNTFLSDLNITLRRDPESKRPRINKEGSQKDREQKEKGKLYYQ